MTTSGKAWGPEALPSYRANLPQPMTVTLREADGSVLEELETASKGFELTQEVLMVVCGKMQVYKASYVTIEREVDE